MGEEYIKINIISQSKMEKAYPVKNVSQYQASVFIPN